jgi:hypothetical protein
LSQLSPAVRMGHVKTLEKISCKYPIRRIEVKLDTVPGGNMNYIQNNMFLGQLPKRLVIGCVDSDGLNGTIKIRGKNHVTSGDVTSGQACAMVRSSGSSSNNK